MGKVLRLKNNGKEALETKSKELIARMARLRKEFLAIQEELSTLRAMYAADKLKIKQREEQSQDPDTTGQVRPALRGL